ncbi:MAG TPA: TfoX/Sxy family protein [Bacteroidia bacterium]|nr:TfoX/Sxy family protein [Bacteroidia bacterium]HNT79310.1 TfoX/Sxy family protein [Bacteroidia bacterium]
MSYNENLAERIRKSLSKTKHVEEKKMMGGLTFMVESKMCVGIVEDKLMCRIDPNIYESALKRRGCKEMDFTGKPMKGYVFVLPSGYQNDEEFNYWIQQSLLFNKKAKASKKKI